MSTFLFDEIIFGPVRSRRLGNSLGINLLPLKRKMCNFNCIYCECGWSGDTGTIRERIPSRREVFGALSSKLEEMRKNGETPDVLTYAGNGEPTLHPDFPGIIDDSIMLRDKYFPQARIAVLSNASTIKRPEVREALMKADMNILKLDSAFNETIRVHNQPDREVDAGTLIEDLAAFKGKVIIQTLFVRGSFRGRKIDNTTPSEIEAWLKAISTIKPSEVMIYTISRDTPEGSDLEGVPEDELNRIAEQVGKLGIRTRVSA
jgi:wyosine [tRNA(Phe)-imidazoG37] synthetase (radical SAM superfamily)